MADESGKFGGQENFETDRIEEETDSRYASGTPIVTG